MYIVKLNISNEISFALKTSQVVVCPETYIEVPELTNGYLALPFYKYKQNVFPFEVKIIAVLEAKLASSVVGASWINYSASIVPSSVGANTAPPVINATSVNTANIVPSIANIVPSTANIVPSTANIMSHVVQSSAEFSSALSGINSSSTNLANIIPPEIKTKVLVPISIIYHFNNTLLLKMEHNQTGNESHEIRLPNDTMLGSYPVSIGFVDACGSHNKHITIYVEEPIHRINISVSKSYQFQYTLFFASLLANNFGFGMEERIQILRAILHLPKQYHCLTLTDEYLTKVFY